MQEPRHPGSRFLKDAAIAAVVIAVLGFAAVSASPRPAAEAANPTFPGGGTYAVTTSRGTSTASMKYAPPIKDISFNTTNLSTYLGDRFRNIAWIANRYGGGPAGRWDISDPWNPKEPEVIGLSYGPATDAGRGQPPSHRGPWYNGGWPHSGFFAGATFNDLPSGGARFAIAPGITEARSVSAVLAFAPGFGSSIGQMFDDKWFELFAGETNLGGPTTSEEDGNYVIDATASGKFFLFAGGTSAGGGARHPVYAFDVTGSGSASNLNPLYSQAWNGVTELQIVEVPGVRNHFLVGRAGSLPEEKPRFYVGEIDADSGSITRGNSFTLDFQGISYRPPYAPGPNVLPGSNLEFAAVQGKAYVFMSESFTRSGQASEAPGTLKIAVYAFNTQDLSFSRKGDVSLSNFPSTGFADRKDAWTVARAASANVYPMLGALGIAKTAAVVNSYGETVVAPQALHLNFYGIKQILDAPTPVSLSPARADVVVPGEVIKKPLTVGQVVTVGPEHAIGGPETYHAFLRAEAGRANLYVYRKALLFDGMIATDTTAPYAERPITEADHRFFAGQGENLLPGSFRGAASLRIDRVDVAAFTGGSTTPPGGGGGFGIGLPPMGAPRQPCSARFSSLCDQLDNLRRAVCQLVPDAPLCAARQVQ